MHAKKNLDVKTRKKTFSSCFFRLKICLCLSDFTARHVKWLHHSNATDLANIQTLNFSIAHSFTQIVDFPSNSDRRASLFDLFLTTSPDPHIALCNSDHSVVSVDISFCSFVR